MPKMDKYNLVNELNWAEKGKLYNELVCIDSSIPDILQQVLLEINSYDPAILKFSDNEGLKPKLTTYLLHYILPIYEILCANKRPNIPKLLAVELISFLAWRTFDNCVDGHESPKTAHLSSLSFCIKLIDFVQKNFAPMMMDDVYFHYKVMTEQSLQESEKPIELYDSWKRCSIVFYALEKFSGLDGSHVALFKNYITYTGLAHDMTDFLNDISSHTISLPVHWFLEENEFGLINVFTVKKIYFKVRTAVKPIEDEFISLDIKVNYPIINHLLLRANNLFHEREII